MEKPNFALLIGKKGPPGDADHEKDLSGDSGGDMTSERAENSALQDVITAVKVGDVNTLKTALKDFLAACYPELGGDDEPAEPSPDEEGPPPDMGE